MIGPEIQKALFDALSGASICEGRIYDRVPAGATFPYVTIGDEQVVDDSSSCGESWVVHVDIHVWSRPDDGSRAELKTICAQVSDAIKSIQSIENHTLIGLAHEDTRYMHDPSNKDGITHHGVTSYRFLISATT